MIADPAPGSWTFTVLVEIVGEGTSFQASLPYAPRPLTARGLSHLDAFYAIRGAITRVLVLDPHHASQLRCGRVDEAGEPYAFMLDAKTPTSADVVVLVTDWDELESGAVLLQVPVAVSPHGVCVGVPDVGLVILRDAARSTVAVAAAEGLPC